MSNIQNIQEQLKGLSVEELLVVIAAAAAEAKKAAKTETKKAPKEAKEKKGSMPKGVVPKQLHKPRAWVDFVLADANARGWPAIEVKGQSEPLPASVEREGKHVFESSGKPLNNKQAMSLSKQYWNRKDATGSHPKLYEVFEGQYVAPEPSAPQEAETHDEEKKEAVAEAPKEKEVKKSEEEKAAEKLQKEAEKQAKKEAEKEAKALAKAADKEAKKPKESPKKSPKEEIKVEVKETPKTAAKKVVKKQAPKEEGAFVCEDDGMAREWDFKGKKFLRDFDGNMWNRTDDGEAADWAGKFDPATNSIDASAEEPVIADD